MTPAAKDYGHDHLVGADRVLAVLLQLGDHPQGATLDSLAKALGSPKPTIHRALTSLCKAGLARQVRRGVYALGDEFLRMAFRIVADRPDSVRVAPVLDRLCERYGETVHYAVLEGTDVVYRAKTDPPQGAVRLTSVIGGRNPAYCTAVGKLLLSQTSPTKEAVADLLGPGPYPRRTPNTICELDELWRELELTRQRGFAVDDQENEMAVNCVAVPFESEPGPTVAGAVSISALAFRLPLAALVEQVPAIIELIRRPDGGFTTD